jgi:Mrp family chromosome partitioning ATPase
VNVVSDVLSLTKLVDGVLFVVREKVTSHPNIAGAISKLEFVEAKIIGFTLNGVSMKRGNKSKSKYYYNYYNEKK